MAYLQTLVENPQSFIFRRASIQRRSATTGKYDGVWKDITNYVKSWGTMDLSIDDIEFNRFTDKGVNLTVNNDAGAFNHQSNASSFWFGYLGRYRTMLRLEAGYYDTDMSTEYPSTPTMGIFILDQEISLQSGSNEVYLRASSLKSIFDEVQATDLASEIYNTTMTASQIITKIRDHSDGSGNMIFREFITSTSWTINATTNNYVVMTNTANNLSVWDLMDKLAEAEGYVILVTRTGGIEFRSRVARQGSSQFSFSGQNFPRPTVIEINDYKESWDKYFNYFKLQYLQGDTTSSYVNSGTLTSIGISNASWLFGSRQYQFQNFFPSDTATAQAIVNNLFSLSSNIPVDVTFDAVFVPGLDVLDRIELSYRSYDLGATSIWDVMVWDRDKWGVDGVNFDFNSTAAFLTSIKIDLDSLKVNFTARLI